MSRENYIHISKGNAINFTKIETIDNISKFKNENNLFQFENYNEFSYSENILFNKKDKPAIQIKSNYSSLKAFIRDESENETELSLLRKSDNLNKFLNIDCKVYSNSNNNLSLYFDDSESDINYYDENDNALGIYELVDYLPDFAVIGNYVEVVGFGVLQISNIIIDYDINKKTIVFDEEYTGELISSTAKSTYDILSYNIYEYYFDFTELESGLYDIYIVAKNEDESEIVEYLSENIYLLDEHERTLCIHYYNEDNKDLFYKYELINQLRVDYSDVTRFNVEEVEININDNISNSIKSELNFGNKFLFEDLTTKQLDTLSIALSSESVFINGVGYIKNGNLSIEKQENTNIYSLEAEMLKTNVELKLTNPRLSLIDMMIPNLIPIS